jgi:citrate lyase subunit beta/citryl-CoA lyase
VYPKQVDTVNDVYAKVTPEELVRAKRIVEVFEEAEKGGSASIQIDGEFVDYPLYNRCVQMLKDAGVR